MPAVDIDELKKVCSRIVREGDLDELTDRSVRRSAEKLLSLDENTLEEKVYKQTVKETVAKIIAGINNGHDDSSDGHSDDEDEAKDVESPAAEAAADEDNEQSGNESESSDFDEPAVAAPTVQRKRAPATNKSPQAAKRAKKDESGGKVSKASETTITNLKQYITKCGLRKVWSKELAGLSGAQQIQHLKDVLNELGMEGRPTLEKCKKIKAKRDLLAELEEIGGGGEAADAKPDLEQASVGRSRRGNSARSMKVISDDESEYSEPVTFDMEAEDKAAIEKEKLLDRGSDATPEEEEDEDEESSEESDAYSEGGSESENGAPSEQNDEASDDDEAGMDSDSD
ncbi:hypothetical protein GGI00_005368 [Coemansia sp. RSA 2681]|nr:hypothetical protein GGI00_005368 [Coemansia sp. RSA 2681]